MLYLLILSVVFSVTISAFCSLMEAVLYAVPLPYVRHLEEGGHRAGRLLAQFKAQIERPISAILILNTVANTAGAAVAGWAYGQLWGDRFGELGLVVFSASFILAILIFSEIVPKTLGVTYARGLSVYIAYPLQALVALFSYPIRLSAVLSEYCKKADEVPTVSQEEVLSMAALGTEEGALDHFEGSVITNVIGLDKLLVKDVLTPRVVVFRLEETMKLAAIESEIGTWPHSRVPLYRENDPDHLTSYVLQRDIYRELLRGNRDESLRSLGRPLQLVPELMRVDKLLLQMFEKREQICSVVDEHGGLAGIITLEDIMEEVVGREIVDEYDTVTDLRTFAKILKVARSRKKVQAK